MSLIDPQLAAILVCPVDMSHLVCTQCGRRYPVQDGIPVMLVEEAEGGPDE
jgi:hypothetical protein